MAFVEDLTLYYADFGVDATLAGVAVRVIFDTASEVVLDGLVTQAPTALLTTAAAHAAAPGQSLVVGATTYSVRAVLRQPPDGAMTRLVLVRAA